MIWNTNLRWRLPVVCLLLEVVMIVLFGVFVRYDMDADPHWVEEKAIKNLTTDLENEFYYRYPSFQDVHVMIFVGFGFLMTFLKRYGYSSLGFNFLLAAFGIQWALLMQGWLHSFDGRYILVNVENLINADFCVGSVCVAFGAVLGKVSPVQLLIMTLLQVTLFSVNEYILLNLLEVKDAGGSMTIHAFGAYFGLTVAWILYRPNLNQSEERKSSVYHSDLFAMIGTLFLWMYWPSFNSAISNHGDAQHRAVINTYCSLAACVLTSVALSSALHRKGKLDMVHIQNASLAGGVGLGTVAELMILPFGSLLIGFICGIVSTLGFVYLTPFLESRLRIQDTCGVHNLHGLPGIIGGAAGAVIASIANIDLYGEEGLAYTFGVERSKTSWNPNMQGRLQAAGLFVSLAMALVGGIIVGLILRLPFWGQPPDENCFDDSVYWEEADPWGVKSFILQCVCMLSHVQLLATLWAVACQARLSMRFPRQEYWGGFSYRGTTLEALILEQYFPKYSAPWSSSSTWELVRNTNSQVPPRPPDFKAQGAGPSPLSTSPPHGSDEKLICEPIT